MSEKQIQEHLFQRIREQLPPERSLVETVSEILHVSQDSAYRRIRGETLLVLEEARVLCQEFSLSLDQLFQLRNNSVVFDSIEIHSETYDFDRYLRGILQQLKQLSSFSRKSLVYVANDIPLFHQLCFRPLFNFRYYFWMKNIYQHPDFVQQKFSPHLLPKETEALGMEIAALYCQIPSTEIWNIECINSILQQLTYCLDAGLILRSDASLVIASLQQMLEHLQLEAEFGRRFLPGENPQSKKDNFQLFYNRLGLGSNLILASHHESQTLYLNCNSLDYLISTDKEYCNKVTQKLQTTMRRSTLISSVSEKQRNMFFNSLYARLPFREKNKEKPVS